MRLVTDTVEYGTKNMPKWNTISISGYHIREAGSTAVKNLLSLWQMVMLTQIGLLREVKY